jgi:hypothetical protein
LNIKKIAPGQEQTLHHTGKHSRMGMKAVENREERNKWIVQRRGKSMREDQAKQ